MVIGVCVAYERHFKFKSRQEMQLTVRSAIDSGQPLSPEVLADLSRALSPPQSDLRKGIVLCAIGLAFVVLHSQLVRRKLLDHCWGSRRFPFWRVLRPNLVENGK